MADTQEIQAATPEQRAAARRVAALYERAIHLADTHTLYAVVREGGVVEVRDGCDRVLAVVNVEVGVSEDPAGWTPARRE